MLKFQIYYWKTGLKKIDDSNNKISKLPLDRKNLQNLAAYEFEWILPGHGRRYHSDKESMKQAMQKCVDWMETV